MAQKTIRKGFFFYFGLFVLILVAGFLVCLVIMMFNPGANVLGMQYFTGNSVVKANTTDGGEIGQEELATIDEITVNCRYANVTVQANTTLTKGDGIYIVNRAKGFVLSKDAVKFGYSVTKTGSKLVVDVQEPKGFLFFSKNVEVIINSYETWHLNSNLKLNVKASEDADIRLGGNATAGDVAVKLAGADIETAKGTILLSKHCDVSTFTGDVRFATDSGRIRTEQSKLTFNADVHLEAKSGRINFSELDLGAHKLYVKYTNGTLAADKITANTIYADTIHGNFVVNTVVGNMTFEECQEKTIQPLVNIENFYGDFNLSVTNTETEVAPEIVLGKITGELLVIAKKGKIRVGLAEQGVHVESDGSLYTNITLASNNTQDIKILQATGNINLNFKGNVSAVTLKTTTGKVAVNFTNAARFVANAVKESDGTPVEDKNIKVEINDSSVQHDGKNPLVVGSTHTGAINISTNSSITYTCVANI